MCNQHNCLVCQQPLDTLVKYVLGCVLVHSRQWVVQQQQLGIMVCSTSQAHTLTLAPREVDASLSSNGRITCTRAASRCDNLPVLISRQHCQQQPAPGLKTCPAQCWKTQNGPRVDASQEGAVVQQAYHLVGS